MPEPAEQSEVRTLGTRVHQYRKERGLSLAGLAESSGLSKSFLSDIERGETSRPSGETLYAIASALGVLMSDLLGRKLVNDLGADPPPSLLEFAEEQGLPEADVQMLAHVNFRGERPRTKERWAHIYSAIRATEWMDERS
jgi:transcriptional regulator with XRE-family HTH domain